MARVTNCEECPLNAFRKARREVKAFNGRKFVGTAVYDEVPYRGNKEAEVVLVGESPGGLEVYRKSPFVGDSGTLLERMFREAGFDLSNAFIANACRCMIVKDELKAQEVTQALVCCRPAMEMALRILKPKLIVCLGDIAMRQVIKKTGITKHRGVFVWSKEFECWVVPIYHPAYCLRDARHLALWRPDIEQIVRFIRRGFVHEKISHSGRFEEAESIRDILDASPEYVAVDTETQGLDWLNPSSLVISYSVSAREGSGVSVTLFREAGEGEPESFVIQWPRKVGRKKELTPVRVVRAEEYARKISELRELLENKNIKKIMMNGNYDLVRFRQLGIERVESYVLDVQLAAHVYDPDTFKLASLADIQRAFLPGVEDHKTDCRLNKEDMLASLRETPEEFHRYAALDAERTLRLGHVLREKLKEDIQLARYYVRCAHPVTVGPLLTIHRNGISFDMERIHEARESIAAILRAKEEEFLRLVPAKVVAAHAKAGLKLSRTAFVRDVFFSKNGFGLKPVDDPAAQTATGQVSMSRKLLVLLREKLDEGSPPYEALTTLIEWGPFQKLYTTYLNGFLKAVRSDGRIHPWIRKATATGRTSSTDPNLQNIPKRNKDIAAIIRRLLYAPKGKKLVAIDYSQNELRWIAFRSRDEEFLRVYRDGEDIHAKTALTMLGVESKDAVTPDAFKAARTAAKSVNFGFVYGMSAKGFLSYARDNYGLRLTLEEAERYRESFFARYAGLPEWHKREVDFARRYGYIRTPFGAVRRLPNILSPDTMARGEDERKAINTPIQAAGNDSTLLAADEAMRRGLIDDRRVKLVLFVHDELVFEVDEDFVEQFVPAMVNLMRGMGEVFLERFGLSFDVPLDADASVGDNLAEMEELKV